MLSPAEGLFCPEPSDTAAAARALLPHLRPGLCITLSGEPGAGKTFFAAALIGAAAERCGVRIGPVTSPTFSLMQVYDVAPVPIAHGDAYRITHPDAFIETGLEELLSTHAVLIEWPEHVAALLPAERLALRLHERTIALQPDSSYTSFFAAMREVRV